jgi:hypothetical protein
MEPSLHIRDIHVDYDDSSGTVPAFERWAGFNIRITLLHSLLQQRSFAAGCSSWDYLVLCLTPA